MAKREQRNIPCVIPCGGNSTSKGQIVTGGREMYDINDDDVYALTTTGRNMLKRGDIRLFLGTARPIDKTILHYLGGFEEGRTFEQISSATTGNERLVWGHHLIKITPEYRARALHRLLEWDYIKRV